MLHSLSEELIQQLGLNKPVKGVESAQEMIRTAALESQTKLIKTADDAYHLSVDLANLDRPVGLFDESIISLSHEKDHVYIKINTTKQVTLSGTLNTKNIEIVSPGPVVFDTHFNCERLSLDVGAACFNYECRSRYIYARVSNGLALLRDLAAEDVLFDAGMIYQSGNLDIQNILDIRTANYTISPKAKIVAEDQCRILSKNMVCHGAIDVTGKAFFVVGTLEISGDAKSPASLAFAAAHETYFRGDIVRVCVNSQFICSSDKIGGAELCATSFFVEQGAELTLTNSILNADKIDVYGNMMCTGCSPTKVNEYVKIYNGGVFTASKTKLQVGCVVVHEQGEFAMGGAGSALLGGQLLSNGLCTFNGIDEFKVGNLCFYSNVTLIDCEVVTDTMYCFYGTIERATVRTDLFLQEAEGNIVFQNSWLISLTESRESYFIFNGDVAFIESSLITPGTLYSKPQSQFFQSESRIEAGTVLNDAEFVLDDSLLRAEHFDQRGARLFIDGSSAEVGVLHSQDSLVSATHSRLVAGQFSHSGELVLESSQLQSAQQIIRAEFLDSSHASVSGGSVKFYGDTIGHGVQLSAREVELYGAFEFSRSMLRALDEILVASDARGNFEDVVLKAKKLHVLGNMTLAGLQCHAEQCRMQGDIEKMSGASSADLTVCATSTLTIAPTANIHVDRLMIASPTTQNAGWIQADRVFQVKGDLFYNSGQISSKLLTLFLNYGFFNVEGELSADNILISANSFNFGSITARENYTHFGFFDVNMGLLFASNAVSNSLLSFNAGLHLPCLSANWRSSLSFQNIYGLARASLKLLLPFLHDTIDFVFVLPNLLMGAHGVYELAKKYNSWEKIRGIQLYDIMPAICRLRGGFNLGMGSSVYGLSATSELLSLGEHRLSHTVPIKSLAAEMFNAFSGQVTGNSLVHLNFGLEATQNATHTSFFDFNSGAEIACQSYSAKTNTLYNSGFLGGDKSSFLAHVGHNTGMLYGFSSLGFNLDQLYNEKTGVILGDGLHGSIDVMNQFGMVKWSNGSMRFKKIYDINTAITSFHAMVVKADEAAIHGDFELWKTQGDVDDLSVNQGSLDVYQSMFRGKHFNLDGQVSTSDAVLTYDIAMFSQASQEHLGNNTLLQFGYFDDASRICYDGRVFLESAHYRHTGDIRVDGNPHDDYFSVRAHEASLQGSAHIGHGRYDIENFDDANAFLRGANGYDRYQFLNELRVGVNASISIERERINRLCDLVLDAKSIVWAAVLNPDQALFLKSRAGDIQLVTGEMSIAGLGIDSSGDVYTNGRIDTKKDTQIIAKGVYTNLGGELTARNLRVTAAQIYNVAPGSEYSQAYHGTTSMGGAGILNAIERAILEATAGNIENHGGVIHAGIYTQLVASSDIKNLCIVKSHRGAYDIIQEFDPGLIAGGSGNEDTQQVGLYVKANGCLYGEASDFLASGDAYLSGDKGVAFEAKAHTYVSEDRTKRYGLFRCHKKHVIETRTTIKGCTIRSDTGRNIIFSSAGGVSGVAADFISPGGTDMYAQQKVALFSLKTQDRHYEEKSNFWGLSGSKRSELIESAKPTLIFDNGQSRIHSAESDVDLRGALVLGDGDFSVCAHGQILFGRPVLNVEIHETTHGFGISLPGAAILDAYRSGGVWEALTSSDATLAKIDRLIGSRNGKEVAANTFNLGIDAINTASSIARGVASNTLGAEVLSRYGLGGAGGFMPKVTLSFTRTRTDEFYQFLGEGGVDRGGNGSFKSDEGIEVGNGAKVHVDGNMDLDAPEVVAKAAELHSKVSHREQSVGVGLTPAGVVDAGASAALTVSESQYHENAELSCGGKMTMHHGDGAMQRCELDGARASAKEIEGSVDELEIVDKTNHTSTKHVSGAVSTTGAVSAAIAHSHSDTVGQQSGIFTNSVGERGFNVDHADMHGGVVSSEVGQANINELSATPVREHSSSESTGFAGNITDLQRLDPSHAPGNATGDQAIATVGTSVDESRYDATVTPVVHSEAGLAPAIGHASGSVEEDEANSRAVTHDESTHLRLDVPLFNPRDIATAERNITGADRPLDAALSRQLESVPDVVDMDVQPDRVAQDMLAEAGGEDGSDPGAAGGEDNVPLEVALEIMQFSGEQVWEQLGRFVEEGHEESMLELLANRSYDQAIPKGVMRSQALLFIYTMNVLKGRGVGSDRFLAAAADTVDSLLINTMLSALLGPVAVPANAALLAAELADLMYDEKAVEREIAVAEDLRSEAMKLGQKNGLGNFLAQQSLFATIGDMERSAGSGRAWHILLSKLHPIGDAYRAHSTAARKPG